LALACAGGNQLTAIIRTLVIAVLAVYFADSGRLPARAAAGQQAAVPVLPVLKRDSLLNGLQLIVNEQKGVPSPTVKLRIASGAAFDLAGKGGLADLTAGMLLKGGGGFDAKSVVETVGQLGLSVNISVDWDSTNITLSGPPDSLESMFELIGRLVITPSFDQKEFDALKAQRTAAIAAEEGNQVEVSNWKAMETLFGSHPYARPARGTSQTVSQIVRADLLYFHKRFYLANNAALVVTGDVKAEEVTRLSRARLGSWKKGEKVPSTFRPPDPLVGRRVVVLDRPSETAQAVIAQIGVSRRDKDYFPVLVMAELLRANVTRGASSSPGVRVETRLEARFLPGPLSWQISSSPGAVSQSIDAVLSAMSALQTELPALDQVEAAKGRVVSSFAERLARADTTAEVILDIETYDLGKDYLMNFGPRVNAVTPREVQRVAMAHLKPGSVAVVVSGPASAYEQGLKKLGAVTVIP
jgi:zinc protease